MVDEGYVTIADLILAFEMSELTFESVAEMTGMKKGHYNRLSVHLKKFKIDL